jgi:hypothetical protein
VDDRSYTVNEFCTVERISRSQLYEDWKANKGPRFYWNGKHRRISHEARVEWRRRREAEAAALEAALGDEEAA